MQCGIKQEAYCETNLKLTKFLGNPDYMIDPCSPNPLDTTDSFSWKYFPVDWMVHENKLHFDYYIALSGQPNVQVKRNN